jgi:hypothetical protein
LTRASSLSPNASDVREVAALDRRDFQVVAPRHLPKGQRLTLLPEDSTTALLQVPTARVGLSSNNAQYGRRQR